MDNKYEKHECVLLEDVETFIIILYSYNFNNISIIRKLIGNLYSFEGRVNWK